MLAGLLKCRGCLPTLPEMVHLPVDSIEHDPHQPRNEGDGESLKRLARSLMTHGQLQPIVVRPTSEPGRFRLVVGERRRRAAILAGRDTVLAIVRDLDRAGEDSLILQLVEDSLREDLSSMDRAFRSLMDRRGWNASELADSLQLHRGTVSSVLALLDLPDDVRDEVEEGRIPADVAREMSRMVDTETRRLLASQVAVNAVDRSESIGQTRRSVRPAGVAGSSLRTKVIEVEGGRVTIRLNVPGKLSEFAAVMAEAVLVMQDELRRQSEDSRDLDEFSPERAAAGGATDAEDLGDESGVIGDGLTTQSVSLT